MVINKKLVNNHSSNIRNFFKITKKILIKFHFFLQNHNLLFYKDLCSAWFCDFSFKKPQ